MRPLSQSVAFCVFAVAACAQPNPQQTQESTVGNCKEQNLAGFTIRSARVNDPFWMLRWRKLDDATLAQVTALAGKPYFFETVNAVSKQIENKGWLPDTPDTRAEFSFSEIAVENCRDHQLDVVFTIFSAAVSSTLSSLLEWRTQQVQAPAQAAGVSKANAPVQASPQLGFDSAKGFFAGGATRLTLAPGSPFQSIDIAGTGSSASRNVEASLNGAYDSPDHLVSHIDWRLHLKNTVLPTATDGELGQSTFAGQFTAMTKPLHGIVYRAGGLLEGGMDQGSFRSSSLAANSLLNTNFTSAKLYAGITGNWTNQALAASFGAQFGSTRNGFHGDWRKLIGDVSHQLWLNTGKRRTFDLDQRFSVGGIQNLGRIPVAERFFGGNHDVPFIPGSDWVIRSAPVIRSIPTNRMYLTAAGIGGDRFFAYNSTTAWTVWGLPVIPKELDNDPQFRQLLNGAITSDTSILVIYYESKDPHFVAIRNAAPGAIDKLIALQTVVTAAQASAPDPVKPQFRSCLAAIRPTLKGLQHLKDDKPISAYGYVADLLPDGDNSIADVLAKCRPLADAASAPSIKTAADEFDSASAAIPAENQKIDVAGATSRANADTKFVKRTLDIITNQMTITSVSPVFVFDVARLGPNPSGASFGNRYAVGGGLRVTLLSTVSFTIGYAANVHPRPGEGKGALFLSFTTRNILE